MTLYATPTLRDLPTADVLTTNGFTIGMAYQVIRLEGSLGVVINDNGHERVIGLDGAPSAHLKGKFYSKRHPLHAHEVCVGYFQIDDVCELPFEDNDTECPACSGPGVELGTFGRTTRYRCRNCGLVW